MGRTLRPMTTSCITTTRRGDVRLWSRTLIPTSKEAPSDAEAPSRVVEDELVEVAPTAVRLRKRMLSESERKKAARQAKDKMPAGA